jgi:Protein of unknown function (DUF1207)
MKVRTALFVGVGIVLSLFSPDSLWAGPTPERVASSRWSWLRIAFTDKETDFVPPPPRDESADEGEVAEPLFEGAEPLDEQFEEQVAEDLLGSDRPPIDLRDREPVVEHPFPLAQQRDHFDPGFTQDANDAESWQVMPSGLMYRSYLAGEKESRMSSVWAKDQTGRTVWESTLGGRVGLLRHGTTGADRPQGWQLDFEGAALVRVLPGTDSTMLEAVDYRAGFLSTWAFDNWHVKAGYSHFCAHLGDEYVIANPMIHRFNYVRDSVVLGVTYDINSDWQAYGEIAYALSAEDGAEPLELQYGLQYSPLVFGLRGAPFAAVNGHSRQDFGGITSVNCQAGWQWRGTDSQHLWRMGLQYYTGPALQYAFPGSHDHLLGGGLWFDY